MFLVVVFFLPSFVSAQELNPNDSLKASVQVLEEMHLSKKKLTDELRMQWADRFIASVDPRKMYFLESDVAEFHEQIARKVDDEQKGEWSFARFVHARLNKRLTTCVATIDKFLAAEHDYTVDESVTLDFDNFASDERKLADRWRKRIKFELMLEKTNGSNRKDANEFLKSRYSRIQEQWSEMESELLSDFYLNALAEVFDEHCRLFSEKEMRGYIGSPKWHGPFHSLLLPLHEHKGRFIVMRLTSAPWRRAEREELIGWSILAIRGPQGDVHHLTEMPDWHASYLLRSEYGALEDETDVTLELYHPVTHQRMSKAWQRVVLPW